MTTARIAYPTKRPWTAPVGTAAHDFKHGRILPLERPRRPLLARLFGGTGRG